MILSALPPLASFEAALADFQRRWPGDGYFDARPRFAATYELLRRFAVPGNILDVGGWPGNFGCSLALMQQDILLLDKDLGRPTKKTLDEKTGSYSLAGGSTLLEKCQQCGVRTLSCDIERESIPLADQSIDNIVFTEVIEHLRNNPLHALRELHRILKPNGRIVITTPNLLSLRNRVSFLFGSTKYDTLAMPFDAIAAEEQFGHGGHFRVFSMLESIDLLSRTGFRVLHHSYRQIQPENGAPHGFSFYRARMGVYEWLVRVIRPLGNTLCLVATRDQ